MFDLLGLAVAVQFKPDGRGGYLYRRDQIGPALAATAAERDRHVSRMGWMMLLGTVLYMLGIIAMAVIAQQFVDSASASAGVGVGGAPVTAGIAFGGLYLFIRCASHAPARAFAGRPEVAPAQTRKQVFGTQMARMTYTRIVLIFAAMAAMLVIATLDQPGAVWLAVGMPAAIGAAFAIWKWRIENA